MSDLGGHRNSDYKLELDPKMYQTGNELYGRQSTFLPNFRITFLIYLYRTLTKLKATSATELQ